MSIIRRSFLKLGTVVAGTLVLTKYIEQSFDWKGAYTDWIEDQDNFTIVRIPAFKTLSKVTFDKPTIFLLGEEAKVTNIVVNNFANISMPKGGGVYNSMFDVRKSLVEGRNCTLLVGGNSQHIAFEGLHLIGSSSPYSTAIQIAS